MAKYQASPYKQEALDYVHSRVEEGNRIQDVKQEASVKFGITVRTIDRYLEEEKNPKHQKGKKPITVISPEDTQPRIDEFVKPPPKTSMATPSGNATDSVQTAVRPVRFILNGKDVLVDSYALEDAHKYFLDIQELDPEVVDDFGTACKVAMQHVWRHIYGHNIAQRERKLLEDNENGRFEAGREIEENGNGAVETPSSTG